MKEEALKLADEAKTISTTIEALEWIEKASDMIRKLVAELDKQGEPVAWIDYLEDSNLYDLNVSGRGVPLYTAPQKPLSDEEIIDCLKNVNMFDMKEVARAILKKASEK